MGQNASQRPIAPWESPDSTVTYSPAVVQRIKDLSQHSSVFLARHPSVDMTDFNLEACRPILEGALQYDPRISKFLPKLVPKRVTEEQFWSHYLSHVQAAVSGLNPAPIPAKAAGAPATPASPAPVAVGVAVSATGTPSVSVAPALGAAKPVSSPAPNGTGLNGVDHKAQSVAAVLPALSFSLPQLPVPARFVPLKEEEMDQSFYTLHDEEPIQTLEKDLHRQIRWGIIGAGSVCEVKSGPAFYKAHGSKLVAIMRRNVDAAKEFAARHKIAKVYASAQALIADPEVDAVYIATPPGSHVQLALQVCAAGKPCIVEKPMGRHYDECRQMADAFFRANVPLYVAHYRRRHERFIKAKQIIDRFLGKISSVTMIMQRSDHLRKTKGEIGWRVEAEESGGGLFMDLAPHALDILDYLLGPLGHVTGDAVNMSPDEEIMVETGVSMTFRTPGGAVGTALWDFCSAHYKDELVVCGTKGALSMSIFGKEGPTLHLPSGKKITYEARVPEHNHLPLVESIVAQLRGAKVSAERVSSAEVALRTSIVMDAVLRKFYKSRSDHFWKRPQTWENSRQQTYSFLPRGAT